MAIAFVQKAAALTNSGTTTQAVVWAGNPATGNLIVVICGTSSAGGAAVSSITDSQSNKYQLAGKTTQGSFSNIEIWYSMNITGGTTPTVTVTLSGASVYRPAVCIREYSGVATTNALDTVGFITSTSATAFTPNALASSRTINGLVVIGAHCNATGTWSAGAGFSNIQTQNASTTGDQGSEDKIVSVSGTQSGTITDSAGGHGSAVIAVFSDTPVEQPSAFNNMQFVRAEDGMSVSEKIR